MQIKRTDTSDTQVTLSLGADEKLLMRVKDRVVQRLAPRVKLPGFRSGKAPISIIEKNIDQKVLQTEVLEDAVNEMYGIGLQKENLRPVGQPAISLKKYVPFTEIEFEAEIEVVGPIKLGDYKSGRKPAEVAKVTAKDIEDVIDNLKLRLAERKDVDREAKNKDQVWIDFAGFDPKGNPVPGADGKDYPLALGSDTFIPGFEDKLLGVKAGDEKEFTLTFPKDYRIKSMAGNKVTFKVKANKVQEVVEPKVDDDFAAKSGPFKTVEELKADIKKQLAHERELQARRQFEDDLVMDIVGKSNVTVPQTLLAEQTARLMQDLKQNLMYRGQTLQEFLDAEGKTEEQYTKEDLEPEAKRRVSAGLVLSEIAEKENITVTPEELEIRIQILKGQYQDQAMQEELDKPENRREIAARLLTEKTVNKLADYATKQ
jgi:trigger factor